MRLTLSWKTASVRDGLLVWEQKDALFRTVEDTSLIHYSASLFSRNYSPTKLIAYVDSLQTYSTKGAENLLQAIVYTEST